MKVVDHHSGFFARTGTCGCAPQAPKDRRYVHRGYVCEVRVRRRVLHVLIDVRRGVWRVSR